MKKIGITGQIGFIGTHLYNTLGLMPDKYKCVPFEDEYFQDQKNLDNFIKKCDVIVHLAAMNRHNDPQVIYDTNLGLVQTLIDSLIRTNSKAHILFSSSSQELKNNLYGKSKLEGRKRLAKWAKNNGGKYTGLVIPNVFGPFCKPNYNSFIATFSYKLTHEEIPKINEDSTVNLIYVGELVDEIIGQIDKSKTTGNYIVPHTYSCRVSHVLSKLYDFKDLYLKKGEIPNLKDHFDLNLFHTFRSYIDNTKHFPIKFMQHTDSRGSFIEVIRLGTGGQCSFLTTVPQITRGNHFHTRKIERFAVIKGKALIQLRKIDSDEILNFYLDGRHPAYLDVPIWYTHNIKNIGNDELLTILWINEAYNPEDPDTYSLKV